MANITNQQKINALKDARHVLENKSYNYAGGVCAYLPYTDAGMYLRRYITKQLGGCIFLTSWIAQNRPQFLITPSAMKKHRLQWIDWMIASLEGKN